MVPKLKPMNKAPVSEKLYLDTKLKKNIWVPKKKLIARVCKILTISSDDITGINSMKSNEVVEVLAKEVSSRITPDDFEHLSVVVSYINISPSTILSWISPEGRICWNASRNLMDLSSGYNSAEPKLGYNFRPMLLARLPKHNWWEMIEAHSGRDFFMETKYDGEHVLMHKISRCTYKWYTRNGKDFTADYGASSSEKLSGRIHGYFLDTVTDCIIDCELMLWDKKLRKLCRHQFMSDNSDKTKHSFRHIKHNDSVQLVVVVFDLLFYNGQSIMNVPLEQRVRLLDSGLLKTQSEEVIFISPRVVANSRDEVDNFYGEAMRNGDEGIVIKNRNIVYQPGTRKKSNGWFKLKPNIDNELDLALVAVNPERTLDGKVAYQVAVRNGNRYKTISYCCSGLTLLDRKKIYEINTIDGPLLKEAPPDLDGFYIDHPKGGFMRKEHWIVVEVASSGIRDGKLIDPVIRRIRYDKSLGEIDTLETFLQYDEIIRRSKLPERSLMPLKSRKITKKSIFHESAVPNIKRKKLNSPIAGKTICVLQGTNDNLRKRIMEVLTRFGAYVVGSPVDTTDLIIACTDKHPKTRIQVADAEWSVIRAVWVLRCEELDEVVPWIPEEVLNEVEGSFRIEIA
uniref:DNA ligase IV n=1 Tax=Heterorhabditis bacteriophora TaxID=37862 RepID=A0A1I7XDG0_HETBA